MDDLILCHLFGELHRLEQKYDPTAQDGHRVAEIQSVAREWGHPGLSALCARVLARMEHRLNPGSTRALRLARQALRLAAGINDQAPPHLELKAAIHALLASILKARQGAAADIEAHLRSAVADYGDSGNATATAEARHQLVSYLVYTDRLGEAFGELHLLYAMLDPDRFAPGIVLTHAELLQRAGLPDLAMEQLGNILEAYQQAPHDAGSLGFYARLAHEVSAEILIEQGDAATALSHLNQLAEMENVQPGTTNCPLDLVKRMANAHEKLGNRTALRVLLAHPIAVLQETGADNDSLFELLMTQFVHLLVFGEGEWLPLYELACRTNSPAHFEDLKYHTPVDYKCLHRSVHSWARRRYQDRGDALGAARTRVAEAKAILPGLRGRTSRRAARETDRLLELIGSVPITATAHHDADLLLEYYRVGAALHQLEGTPRDGSAKCHLLAAILLADQIGDAAAALETRGDLVAFLQQRGLQREAQPWIAEIQHLRDAANSEPSDTEPPMAA